MLEIISNPTTKGIIIGSSFTLLGVIINGIITYLMARSSHAGEVEENKRCEQKKDADAKLVRREKAYRDFANYYGFMNLLIGLVCASNSNQTNGIVFREIFAEKLKENLAKTAEVLTEISLFGSSIVSDKCARYVKVWNIALNSINSLSLKDCANLDQELLSVVNEMRKELGFDSL